MSELTTFATWPLTVAAFCMNVVVGVGFYPGDVCDAGVLLVASQVIAPLPGRHIVEALASAAPC
jgi:hypothetical protein